MVSQGKLPLELCQCGSYSARHEDGAAARKDSQRSDKVMCSARTLTETGTRVRSPSQDKLKDYWDDMASKYTSLPGKFQTSYLERDTYPSNCMQTTVDTYPSALAEYATRLDQAAGDLCEIDVSKVDISFRDLRVDQGAGKSESQT